MSSPTSTPSTPSSTRRRPPQSQNGTSPVNGSQTPVRTPRNRNGNAAESEVETPMRGGLGGRSRDGTANIMVENSDSLNVPTSPAAGLLGIQPTSPLPGAINNMSEIDLSSPLNYGTPSSMGSVRTPRSGIRGTPVRARPDIRTDKRMRQVNIGADAVSFKFVVVVFFLIKYYYIEQNCENNKLMVIQ